MAAADAALEVKTGTAGTEGAPAATTPPGSTGQEGMPQAEDVFEFVDIIPKEELAPVGKPAELLAQTQQQLQEVRTLGGQWEQYARGQQATVDSLRAQIALLQSHRGGGPQGQPQAPARVVPEGVEDPHTARLFQELAAVKQQLAAVRSGIDTTVENRLGEFEVSLTQRELRRDIPLAVVKYNEDGTEWVTEAEIIRAMQNAGAGNLSADDAARQVATRRKRNFAERGFARRVKQEPKATRLPGFPGGGPPMVLATPPKSMDEFDAALNQNMDIIFDNG